MVKKLYSVFLMITIGIVDSVIGAYLVNVPQTITQPDGEVIKCFASGDEFNNWLHDADGYTIIQDDNSGDYVYADKVNDELVSSAYRVGKVDPANIGLKKYMKPSSEQQKQKRYTYVENYRNYLDVSSAPNSGTVNNIVIFIRFSDESEFGESISTYDVIFNATSNSMDDYFREASYNQFGVSSSFYPAAAGGMVVSFRDTHPRNYYKVYNSVTNPVGYTGDYERIAREHALVKNAINAISSQIPTSLAVDGDNDGYVDNVCIITYGSPAGWSELLWPHSWVLFNETVFINGKRVWTFTFQLQTTLDVAVLCHEMFHSVGAPDLYHYSHDGLYPAGPWDVMAMTGSPPQHMGAYLKYKYGSWISGISEITAPGLYTLNPVTSPSNNCFKIASPFTTTEYFIVEYRNQQSSYYESVLPGSGLLVYRIDPSLDGNADGPPDEVYIYRPGGTPTFDGNVYSAHFNSTTGRTQINDSTDPSSFLADGSDGGLNIYNIGQAGNTISFSVGGDDPQEILGDVNGDGVVNSTDGLIVMSCDVGLDVSAFCPMNCGDVNGNGLVNSTDALIIVSYDVGLSVPFPVEESGCPSGVSDCNGCD